jgi:hypothetical protein
MRNILEYPITQEEKDRLILDLITEKGIGDPTPLIFVEILVDFVEQTQGLSKDSVRDNALDFVNSYRATTAYKEKSKLI